MIWVLSAYGLLALVTWVWTARELNKMRSDPVEDCAKGIMFGLLCPITVPVILVCEA